MKKLALLVMLVPTTTFADAICKAICSVSVQKTEYSFPRKDVAWQKVRCEEEFKGKISLIGSMPSFATHYRCMRTFTEKHELSAWRTYAWEGHRDLIAECKAFADEDLEEKKKSTDETYFWDYVIPTIGTITCEDQ